MIRRADPYSTPMSHGRSPVRVMNKNPKEENGNVSKSVSK